jgi:Ca2+-binding EF-hand superfamily protein
MEQTQMESAGLPPPARSGPAATQQEMTEADLLALGEFVEAKADQVAAVLSSEDGLPLTDAQRVRAPEPEPEPEPSGPPGGDPYMLERMDRLRKEFQEDQLRKDFAAADSDGSGAIDRGEFTKLMWKLQGSMSEAEIQQQLDIVDSDGDGEISFHEFRVWWTSPPMEKLRKQHRARLGISEEWDPGDVERRMAVKRAELAEARLVRTFKSVDTDGSGEIELEEWIVLMRKMAPHLSRGAVEWTFQCIDVDGSEAIDFDEFKQWWYSEEGLALRGEPSRQEQEAKRLEDLREQFAQEQAAAEAARQARQEHEESVANEQGAAATRLQAAARGRKQRNQREAERKAALRLQAIFRGSRGRGVVERLKGEAFDEGVRTARDYHVQRMKAREQAAQFLGLPPKISPLVEVAAMKRNTLGQLWMAPGRESPEKVAAKDLERRLSQEYHLLRKSATGTMDRFDFDKWKRGTEIERPGMWDEVDQLKAEAARAEEEKEIARLKEEQRAERLERFEAIMRRSNGEGDEGEVDGILRGPSWVERGSNVSLGRRPSIEAAQRELESAWSLRPRWNAGAALSHYRSHKPSVFGERRPNPDAPPHELAAELASRSNLSFDGSWASVPAANDQSYGVETATPPAAAAAAAGGAGARERAAGSRGGGDWVDEGGSEFIPIGIDYSQSVGDLMPSSSSPTTSSPSTGAAAAADTSSDWRIDSISDAGSQSGSVSAGGGGLPGSTSTQQLHNSPLERPRSAGGLESSSRLYSAALFCGSRRRCSSSSFFGSEAERAIWLQERAKCTMQVGARPVSAEKLRRTSSRLARPPSAEKLLPQIVLEQTGHQMSGDEIDRFVR